MGIRMNSYHYLVETLRKKSLILCGVTDTVSRAFLIGVWVDGNQMFELNAARSGPVSHDALPKNSPPVEAWSAL
jgi:hypothetical protein